MLTAKIDIRDISNVIHNTISYSYGFLQGVEMDQKLFNKKLGEFTVDAFGKYIDSRARVNPEAFHHIYEWDQVGQESARLFELKSKATKKLINFTGEFIPSKTIANNSSESFKDKASIMENSIDIVITPKNSKVLVFEDQGETVFSMSAIHISNPGGDAVAGSFGKATEDFFSNYFTNALLKPFMKQLEVPKEFKDSLTTGVRIGSSAGVQAGRKYINSPRVVIE